MYSRTKKKQTDQVLFNSIKLFFSNLKTAIYHNHGFISQMKSCGCYVTGTVIQRLVLQTRGFVGR